MRISICCDSSFLPQFLFSLSFYLVKLFWCIYTQVNGHCRVRLSYAYKLLHEILKMCQLGEIVVRQLNPNSRALVDTAMKCQIILLVTHKQSIFWPKTRYKNSSLETGPRLENKRLSYRKVFKFLNIENRVQSY